MFSQKIIKALNLGKKETILSHRIHNSILAVICNGINQLSDIETNLQDEMNSLIKVREGNHDKYTVISYPDYVNAMNTSKQNIQGQSNLRINHATKHIHKDDLEDKGKFSIQDEYLNSKTILASTCANEAQSLFTYSDQLRDVTYSMVIDGEVENSNLLMRLSGFVDWLDANSNEALENYAYSDMRYLFLWLVKSIQNCNGDVIMGLNKGLSVLSKNNIGGHYNILFSDGNCICAYSNINKDACFAKKMVYKISRNVHNICCYTIKNSLDTPGLGWSDIKTHNLYYFPKHGAMQVYANIDTNQYSDNRFKTGVNWVCLSLLSC